MSSANKWLFCLGPNMLIYNRMTTLKQLAKPHGTSGVNTLTDEQNSKHLTYDIFKCTSLKQYSNISIQISLEVVDESPNDDDSALIVFRNSGNGLPGTTMMKSSNGNIFRVTGPLCGEFTGHRRFPLVKARDAELWCFLWSAHVQTVQ